MFHCSLVCQVAQRFGHSSILEKPSGHFCLESSLVRLHPFCLIQCSNISLLGPYCADIFNPRAWGGNSEEVTNTITLEFTRIVLAIGVFAIGVELPKAYMAKHWRSLFFLLVPVMTWVRHTF